MKKAECFEQIISEKVYDYRKKITDVQAAWAYLDSASDEQIIEAVEYAKEQMTVANRKQTDGMNTLIVSVFQTYAKKQSAYIHVIEYEHSLHIEIIMQDSFVLDGDDTIMRTIFALAKGICIEADKAEVAAIHVELDYE